MKKVLHNFWRFLKPTTYAKSLQLILILFIAVSIPLVVYVQQKQQTLKQHADSGCGQSYGQCNPSCNSNNNNTVCTVTRNCDANGNITSYTCSGCQDNSSQCGGSGNPTATPTGGSGGRSGGSESTPQNNDNDGPGGCCIPGRGSTGNGDCRQGDGYTEVCDIRNGSCGTNGGGWSCRSAQPTGQAATLTPAQCGLDTDCGWPGRQIWCNGGFCDSSKAPTNHCQSANSLQARFQLNSTDTWGSSKTLTSQLRVNAALFRNGTGELAGSPINQGGDNTPVPDNIVATITGPNGFSKPLSTSDLAAAYSFIPPANGTYTLSGNCQSGAVKSDSAALTVSGISTTPTPTPTPTGTSGGGTPTPQSLSTGTTGGGTITPIPGETGTPALSGDTTIAFTVTMPYAPQTQRTMNVKLNDGKGTTGSVGLAYLSTHNNVNTVMTGRADLGSSFTTGTYDIRIDSAPYIQIIPGVTITAGQSNQTTPTDPMLIGDINGDWKIDVSDYNVLWGCNFNAVNPAPVTPDCKKADLNNDGVVDGIDYNILVRGWLGAEKDNL